MAWWGAIVVHHPAAKYYALTGSGAADRAAANGSAIEAEVEELVGAAD